MLEGWFLLGLGGRTHSVPFAWLLEVFWPPLVFFGFCSIIPISAFLLMCCAPCMCVCVQISLFYKDTVILDLGPTGPRYNLILSNYIYDGSFLKYSHLLKYWGLGLQYVNF